MAKRRTRKQKAGAKHTFTIKWEPGSVRPKAEASVKGQFENRPDSISSEPKETKQAKNSAKEFNTSEVRKNISRSLLFAGIILALEIVLYFVLNVKR